jgi:hypothetical protein
MSERSGVRNPACPRFYKGHSENISKFLLLGFENLLFISFSILFEKDFDLVIFIFF